MINNKDIRTIIDPFLDVPTLNSLLLSFKTLHYGKNGNYAKYVKKILKEKKQVCKHKWYYHLCI
jgi:hypothetical protein